VKVQHPGPGVGNESVSTRSLGPKVCTLNDFNDRIHASSFRVLSEGIRRFSYFI
jgi:hypothetical protein